MRRQIGGGKAVPAHPLHERFDFLLGFDADIALTQLVQQLLIVRTVSVGQLVLFPDGLYDDPVLLNDDNTPLFLFLGMLQRSAGVVLGGEGRAAEPDADSHRNIRFQRDVLDRISERFRFAFNGSAGAENLIPSIPVVDEGPVDFLT